MDSLPKFGSLGHALTILDAGCMLYDNDPRFAPRVFDQLLARRDKDPTGWGAVVSGITYPTPLEAVRWFYTTTADAGVYAGRFDEARAMLPLIQPVEELRHAA